MTTGASKDVSVVKKVRYVRTMRLRLEKWNEGKFLARRVIDRVRGERTNAVRYCTYVDTIFFCMNNTCTPPADLKHKKMKRNESIVPITAYRRLFLFQGMNCAIFSSPPEPKNANQNRNTSSFEKRSELRGLDRCNQDKSVIDHTAPGKTCHMSNLSSRSRWSSSSPIESDATLAVPPLLSISASSSRARAKSGSSGATTSPLDDPNGDTNATLCRGGTMATSVAMAARRTGGKVIIGAVGGTNAGVTLSHDRTDSTSGG
jgi:hypothetical protein